MCYCVNSLNFVSDGLGLTGNVYFFNFRLILAQFCGFYIKSSFQTLTLNVSVKFSESEDVFSRFFEFYNLNVLS